jgi:hypothetical protein
MAMTVSAYYGNHRMGELSKENHMLGYATIGFYAAYFRDPEGNKLCVYKVGPS